MQHCTSTRDSVSRYSLAAALDDRDTLTWLGRFIGRIHAVGRAKKFEHRLALTIERFGEESIDTINQGRWIAPHLETPFNSLAADLLTQIRTCYERAGQVRHIRLHGDCHPGNILWRDGPIFVDMDDCQSGPAVQDLWMLLAGSRDEMSVQLGYVLEGYTQFCDFNHAELHLIEALRSLRMLHHAAWLARRWEDPAFPIALVRRAALLGRPGAGLARTTGRHAGGGAESCHLIIAPDPRLEGSYDDAHVGNAFNFPISAARGGTRRTLHPDRRSGRPARQPDGDRCSAPV
jgi:Ser/Thr protein kinase RdoA (MazF antagonist)